MFQNPFSFKGRICRTEFWFSCFAYLGLTALFFITMDSSVKSVYQTGETGFILIILGPSLWLMGVQTAKRFHDLGKSGWCMINPYHYYSLFFQKGEEYDNQYGKDPRLARLEYIIPPDEVIEGLFYKMNDENRLN